MPLGKGLSRERRKDPDTSLIHRIAGERPSQGKSCADIVCVRAFIQLRFYLLTCQLTPCTYWNQNTHSIAIGTPASEKPQRVSYHHILCGCRGSPSHTYSAYVLRLLTPMSLDSRVSRHHRLCCCHGSPTCSLSIQFSDLFHLHGAFYVLWMMA